jgi:hypothetical protein
MRRSWGSGPTWRPSLLIKLLSIGIILRLVTWGAVKRAPKPGAFILTLDGPVSHCTIELEMKRDAVQLSFVP